MGLRGRLRIVEICYETFFNTICGSLTCFPWSHRREFISLRDDKGKELLLVEHLDQVEPET